MAGRQRNVAMWVGLLATAVCVALASAALRGESSLETAANWAQIVSLAVALPSLVQVVRQLRTLPPPVAVSIGSAEAVLADAVSAQWHAESERRRLDDPAPMPVEWRIIGHSDAMDHPDNITSGTLLTLSANSADIVALVTQFRALRRPRLVILGDGGTGKTTLAVQLVRELLATRASDDPVPVLFNLTGWDPSSEQPLRDWIADRLRRDHPELQRLELGEDVSAQLVRRGRVMPVLDGLDELPAPGRTAVIAQLNRSSYQFILTSRTEEFTTAVRDAQDVLTSALVLEPEPLDGVAVARYLRRCMPPAAAREWADVLAALPANAALSETTSTALGLWLVREVYVIPRHDPAPLLGFEDGQSLRTHLYEHLIPAVVNARPPSSDRAELFVPRRHHEPERIRRWLTTLATLLEHDDPARPPDRDIVWWDLAHLSRVLNAWLGAAVVTTLTAITGIAAFVLFDPLWLRVAFPVVGLAAGVGLWLVVSEWESHRPGYADFHIRGRAREFFGGVFTQIVGILRGLAQPDGRSAVGPAVGILVGTGLVTSQTSTPPPPSGPAVSSGAAPPTQYAVDGHTVSSDLFWDVFSSLAFVVALGLAGLLLVVVALAVVRVSETAGDLSVSSPRRSWRADRALTGVRCLVLGLATAVAVGCVIGTVTGMLTNPATEVAVGAAAGTAAGLISVVVAVLAGGHNAWLAYLITVTVLAARGELPLRLMAFLEDAQRLGLLRTVGAVYQFRHAELQDHLTSHRLS